MMNFLHAIGNKARAAIGACLQQPSLVESCLWRGQQEPLPQQGSFLRLLLPLSLQNYPSTWTDFSTVKTDRRDGEFHKCEEVVDVERITYASLAPTRKGSSFVWSVASW
jgi:hypothetical protein